jgi:hypothetical protein
MGQYTLKQDQFPQRGDKPTPNQDHDESIPDRDRFAISTTQTNRPIAKPQSLLATTNFASSFLTRWKANFSLHFSVSAFKQTTFLRRDDVVSDCSHRLCRERV